MSHQCSVLTQDVYAYYPINDEQRFKLYMRGCIAFLHVDCDTYPATATGAGTASGAATATGATTASGAATSTEGSRAPLRDQGPPERDRGPQRRPGPPQKDLGSLQEPKLVVCSRKTGVETYGSATVIRRQRQLRPAAMHPKRA